MSAHAPLVAQRFHWYPYVSGPVPFQSPVDAVSVRPSTAEPETTGSAVETGAAASTGPRSAARATALPPAFRAVTATVTLEPTSAEPRTYESPVAPETSVQAPL